MRQITLGKLQFTVNQVTNMEVVRGLTAVTLKSEGLGSDGDGCLSLT